MASIIHYTVDLVLVSMLLASIRRQTGLTFVYQSTEFKNLILHYLNLGENCLDVFIKSMEMSGYFKQRK